ncbi:dTDP-4-amino-4,6-dideoxygalactose transaminase [Raineyella antarctica]|uniref:dTDP-4-amino-4,6-dideoxygalactose transaminase n=1 Tax=Raineyella antarctica TaxID=1577474 RepID=A0A1G6HH58_9ACTN|nr:DegT/DnrJ/EryC1/StrS family aminotransferase [Raineyella antarctica]SDB93448.1 dTDP-4-amino-4,6-dideoxygalactose transaminase [Raineyella antarctica]
MTTITPQTTSVPFVDLRAQQREIDAQVQEDLRQVFADTAFIGGPHVARFEQSYAAFLGARHCVGVASGTDALELALRSAGVEAGAEVILPANTFIATAEAVSRIGARPVVVDVDPRYLLIDPRAIEAAITPRTRAIIPVHLFGQAAFVEELEPIVERTGALIIEDAAQSQGARRNGRRAGTLGAAAGTSFYPGKNLGAAGDAGAVITDDDDLAAGVRRLGDHGSSAKYRHDVIGMNSRLDAVQAVVLLAKLARLEEWNRMRREAAARYAELLDGIEGIWLPSEAEGNEHVWHLFTVQVEDRDGVLRRLQERGVSAGIHYPVPVHLTGAYEHLGYPRGAFPVAEAAADRLLSLPMFPHITRDQQEHVAETLAAAVTASGQSEAVS